MKTKSIAAVALLMATSAIADTCHQREQIIQSVQAFLEKAYDSEIADNARIIAVAGNNQVGVRSYPSNDQICVGQLCINNDTCEVEDCFMETVTSHGILHIQGLSCDILEEDDYEIFD